MLPSRSGNLAETISIASSSLQQIQSISSASLLQFPHFRSNRPELFCEKGVLKNFAEFTGVSSGTGVFYEVWEILKNIFFSQNTYSGCFWHLHQSRFPILLLYVISRQLRRKYVYFLSMVERKTSFWHAFSSE